MNLSYKYLLRFLSLFIL